jgi:flotillin
MRVKAAAYNEYNQAAVLDKVISNLPEVVRAIAEPLSKVDQISIVSTGGGSNGNLGANRLTGDIVNIAAQVPLLLEALTGTRMSDLMGRVPGLKETDAASGETVEEAAPTNGAKPTEAPRPAATLNGQGPATPETPKEPIE